MRKQLSSFYCHQLCYGYLNKWKIKGNVQSHFIQHYPKSGFFCLINFAFVVEELTITWISIAMMSLLLFEGSCASIKNESSRISEKVVLLGLQQLYDCLADVMYISLYIIYTILYIMCIYYM